MSGASDTDQTQKQTAPPTGEITPDELLKEVTDRVYAMLLEDLRIERERYRATAGNYRRPQ